MERYFLHSVAAFSDFLHHFVRDPIEWKMWEWPPLIDDDEEVRAGTRLESSLKLKTLSLDNICSDGSDRSNTSAFKVWEWHFLKALKFGEDLVQNLLKAHRSLSPSSFETLIRTRVHFRNGAVVRKISEKDESIKCSRSGKKRARVQRVLNADMSMWVTGRKR